MNKLAVMDVQYLLFFEHLGCEKFCENTKSNEHFLIHGKFYSLTRYFAPDAFQTEHRPKQMSVLCKNGNEFI